MDCAIERKFGTLMMDLVSKYAARTTFYCDSISIFFMKA
jgi:hypothetical protein